MSLFILYVRLRGRRKRGGEGGAKKEKGRSEETYASYKNRAIRITPADSLVIELCQLSIRPPIRKWLQLLRMADVTWEFTLLTAQRELANRFFCGRQGPQKMNKRAFLLQASFPSLPSSPHPDAWAYFI